MSVVYCSQDWAWELLGMWVLYHTATDVVWNCGMDGAMQQCILESVDLWHQSGFLCILLDSIQLPRYLVVYLLLMLCGVFFSEKCIYQHWKRRYNRWKFNCASYKVSLILPKKMFFVFIFLSAFCPSKLMLDLLRNLTKFHHSLD